MDFLAKMGEINSMFGEFGYIFLFTFGYDDGKKIDPKVVCVWSMVHCRPAINRPPTVLSHKILIYFMFHLIRWRYNLLIYEDLKGHHRGRLVVMEPPIVVYSRNEPFLALNPTDLTI